MHNIYYNPVECGFGIVGELSEANMSYEFNQLVVFRATESRKLYWASDSGCSEPTPFEDFSFVSDDENNLNALNKETLDSFISEVRNFPATADERQDLIQLVKQRLK